MSRLRLHIGTHKTGSTSIQHWLIDHDAWLTNRGYALYRGLHRPTNHIELYLAAMRPDRDSFAKRSLRNWRFDAAYAADVGRRIQDHLATNPARQAIFSCEGLSLLRHDDELVALRTLLGGAAEQVSIIVFLRDKPAFLESYRRQLASQPGRAPATDYWSALYVEDDTWLTDYDQLLAVYGRAFGPQNITAIDFDAEVARRGNVLPSLLEWLGLPAADIDLAELARYRFNQGPTRP